MRTTTAAVSVIIAAYNSEATIRRAIRSALSQEEVGECIVVDDRSSDSTLEVARQEDNGTGRLTIIGLPENRGPAFARNTALEVSQSDFVSILDADDYFIEGRLRHLVDKAQDSDFLADDILIVPEEIESAGAAALTKAILSSIPARPEIALDLAAFVRSNISRRGRSRAELGFLKPIMRRSFLQQHGLRYDPKLRLGEDYALYVKALMAGARFRVVGTCGYVAVERSNSLSAQHSIEDLSQLAAFDARCLTNTSLTKYERAALGEHLAATNRNIAFRRALKSRAEDGLVAGALAAVRHPTALGYMLAETAYAKSRKLLGAMKRKDDGDKSPSIRFLIGGAESRS